MTDKQITNKIDISKCEFCEDSEYCYIYSGTADFKWMCKENEDCQIKNLLLQLKSKEQECQQAMDNYVQLDLQRVKKYNELVDLYKAKEQECEELKKIINEAKNSKLDLKSFLVGEAVQNEYEQQLDQLKAENESLKDSLKMFSSTLDWALKSQVGLYKRQIDSSVPDDWEYEEVLVLVEQYIEKIKQTFTEIKEICENNDELQGDFNVVDCDKYKLGKHNLANKILQKISKCEVEE